MPEGPEIYTTTNDLIKVFNDLDNIINNIEIVGGRYHHSSPSYHKNGEPDNWSNLINQVPLTVTGIYCKGKMMWFEFEGTPMVLVSRFGMSGYYGHRSEEEESPKHTAVEFTMLDESVVYYNDVRRFGSFKVLMNGIDSELKRLGPCLIEPPIKHPKVEKISKEDFANLIRSRPGQLARELMKQEVVSGIGNYILSECLYDTKLHPLIKCKDLTQKEAENLYDNVIEIMKRSIKYKGVSIRDYRPLTQGENTDCGADSDNEVKGTGQRHLKVYKQETDPEGNVVQKIKKGPHGRAIYWIPEVQLKESTTSQIND